MPWSSRTDISLEGQYLKLLAVRCPDNANLNSRLAQLTVPHRDADCSAPELRPPLGTAERTSLHIPQPAPLALRSGPACTFTGTSTKMVACASRSRTPALHDQDFYTTLTTCIVHHNGRTGNKTMPRCHSGNPCRDLREKPSRRYPLKTWAPKASGRGPLDTLFESTAVENYTCGGHVSWFRIAMLTAVLLSFVRPSPQRSGQACTSSVGTTRRT